MKKLLCALCLLVFMACNDDDDDKIVSDYDKPYGKETSTELTALIENNINSCEELGNELLENLDKTSNDLQDILDHYGVEVNVNPWDLTMLSRTSNTRETTTFTGMQLTWNKEKHVFDTTISANGFMNVLLPSSVTDDSKNDLQVIMSVDHSSGIYLNVDAFKNEKLLLRTTQQYNEERTERSKMIECPPYSRSIKMKQDDNAYMSTFARINSISEITFKKEGGNSCVISMNIEKGDYNILMEYNNIRLRSTICQYYNLMSLLNGLDNTNEERYKELRLELIQKNMKQSVVVFTDRDEKIGDWEVTGERDEEDYLPIWKCTFKDGKEYLFRLYMPILTI